MNRVSFVKAVQKRREGFLLAKTDPIPLGGLGVELSYSTFKKASTQANKLSNWERSRFGDLQVEDVPSYAKPNLLRGLLGQGVIDLDFMRRCWQAGLIGVDPHTVREIMSQVSICCDTDNAVLITGETGAGKEVVAPLHT